jgi:hypothetical protein
VVAKTSRTVDPSPDDDADENKIGSHQTDNPGVYGGWDESDLPPFVCSEEEPAPKRKPGGK